MSSVTRTVCFTDLVGSSRLTRELGNALYHEVIEDHLTAGVVLAEESGCEYVKNVGDMHIVASESPINALKFAARLLQYCEIQPCLGKRHLQVRVGLQRGEVDLGVITGTDRQDVFGRAMNEGARVEGAADPDQVLITPDVLDAVQTDMGREFVQKYFSATDARELKDLGMIVLHEFDWREFISDDHGNGLASLVMKQLQGAGVRPISVSVADLSSPGVVVWPISPTDVITAIHRAQGEVARLLAHLGWRITVVLTDCGSRTPYDPVFVKRYGERLIKYLEWRQVTNVEVRNLSSLFAASDPSFTDTLATFTEIVTSLKYSDLVVMNKKDYPDDRIEEEMRHSAALRFLRPTLIVSAVLQMSVQENHKTVVLTGLDEQRQWQIASDMPNNRDRLGVLMNPVLRDNSADLNTQLWQGPNWPIWENTADLEEALGQGNVAKWVYRMLAFLPAFPRNVVHIGTEDVSPSDWIDEFSAPPSLADASLLAEHVWPILDPSL